MYVLFVWYMAFKLPILRISSLKSDILDSIFLLFIHGMAPYTHYSSHDSGTSTLRTIMSVCVLTSGS